MATLVSSLTRQAMEIKDLLATKEFDEKLAVKKIKGLYQEGIKLVRGEVIHKSLTKDIPTSVVIVLDETVALPYIQNNVRVHRALGKAYRIFIELTWYKCWRQSERKVWTKSKSDISEHAKIAVGGLRGLRDMDIDFEYSVSLQASKCLQPSESMWEKYIDRFVELSGAAKDLSINDLWQGFKGLTKDCQKDWLEPWYLDVHYLRWKATTVTTLKQYNQNIEEEINQINSIRDWALVTCMAAIFIDIMRSKETEETLKDFVLKKLIEIVHWEKKDYSWNHLKSRISELISIEAARNLDTCWRARYLTIQFFKHLDSKKKPSSYISEIQAALKTRADSLKDEDRQVYIPEKRDLKSVLETLQRQYKELNIKKERLEDQIDNPLKRGSGVNKEELEVKLEEVEKIMEETASKMEQKQVELQEITNDKNLAQIETFFARLDKEELELLGTL